MCEQQSEVDEKDGVVLGEVVEGSRSELDGY